MKASFRTTIYLTLLLVISQTSHAAYIKCWQNKQNIRECSETVPPEYAQHRIEIINDQGIVIKIIQARKTKAQLAKDARAAKKQQAKKERHRQDIILLKTYAKEKDLLLSRDKKLAAIDSSVVIVKGNLRVLNSSREQLQKRAANHERAGNNVPQQLIADIASVKKQISENEKYRITKKQHRKKVKKQFSADLARYRKLKQLRPR